MLDLDNQLLALKKGSTTVDEYTSAFTDKMELALCVVPNELFKIDRYFVGLTCEYSVLVNLAHTFKETI